MRICCIILLIAIGYKPKAQTYARNVNETAEAFVKRIYNVSELAHPVIETKEWDGVRKVIICFHLVSLPDDNDRIVGNILVPIKENTYKQILIDSFYYEGGGMRNRSIETVFFANADKDKSRELFIQSRAQAHSPRGADRDLNGYWYDTNVYDNPDMVNLQSKLPMLLDLTTKFGDEFEGEIYEMTADGSDEKLVERSKAKYKTVDAVRTVLKQMDN